MIEKAKIEDFIRRAEKLNVTLSSGALSGMEKYLDAQYWLSRCETTAEFYVTFHEHVERSLEFLLVHNEGEPPGILGFLVTSDLEKSFPPIDMRPATYASVSTAYGHITAAIKYIMAKVLTRWLSGDGALSDLEPRARAAFDGLWELLGNAKADTKEKWQVYEAILDVAFGRYGRVIEVYEREYRFDLARHENSHRTVIKQCYMLSRIATGKADGELAFGADSYINVLKLDYYLWRVNEDESAEMELVPLVVLCTLYEKIVRGSVPNQHDFFSSMTPRAVLDALESLRRA